MKNVELAVNCHRSQWKGQSLCWLWERENQWHFPVLFVKRTINLSEFGEPLRSGFQNWKIKKKDEFVQWGKKGAPRPLLIAALNATTKWVDYYLHNPWNENASLSILSVNDSRSSENVGFMMLRSSFVFQSSCRFWEKFPRADSEREFDSQRQKKIRILRRFHQNLI